MAGKKIICQRAAGLAGLVPYLHVSDDCAGFLQLARSIATWFQYVKSKEVCQKADLVIELLEHRKWSRAHDECVSLVNLAVSAGLCACFLIDRVQFLDDFSISLIRECLPGRASPRFRSSNSHISESFAQFDLDSERSSESRNVGQVCFLLVHVSHYNLKSASHIAADITRSHKFLIVPIVKVGEASREELKHLFMDLADISIEDRWLDTMVESAGSCAGYFVERAAALRTLSGKLWSEGKQGYIDVSRELVACVPPGSVRKCKQVPVGQISADVAMRFSQVFDGLPPLFQTFSKVLAVASRTGFHNLYKHVMWEVLNDLIADGVENSMHSTVIHELTELGLIKVHHEGVDDAISFQCPALCDIAFDVSTPVQVRCIGHALIERLEPVQMNNFKIPFVIANLHHLVGDEDEEKEAMWVKGFEAFEKENVHWETSLKCKWKEALEEEVLALGGLRTEKFQVTRLTNVQCVSTINAMSEQMKTIKMYQGPISFGPMGQTLTVICRNAFHEFGAFHGYSQDVVRSHRRDMASACSRYIREMEVVERFLSEQGFPCSCDLLQRERFMVEEIALDSSSDVCVEKKVAQILEAFIPLCVQTRLERLHAAVDKLHNGEIPAVIQRADDAFRLAYTALRSTKCRPDATQDALMCMATRNWKPKRVPEVLPFLAYQTVPRIRNKVLKRLSNAELNVHKHILTHVDLEALLIVTPLLYEAQERGEC
jgi:hypothetical protein